MVAGTRRVSRSWAVYHGWRPYLVRVEGVWSWAEGIDGIVVTPAKAYVVRGGRVAYVYSTYMWAAFGDIKSAQEMRQPLGNVL
jgi:hypothetical protein